MTIVPIVLHTDPILIVKIDIQLSRTYELIVMENGVKLKAEKDLSAGIRPDAQEIIRSGEFSANHRIVRSGKQKEREK